eukprot:scaffold9338_cov113-Isochrysis_galbana.AAC.15
MCEWVGGGGRRARAGLRIRAAPVALQCSTHTHTLLARVLVRRESFCIVRACACAIKPKYDTQLKLKCSILCIEGLGSPPVSSIKTHNASVTNEAHLHCKANHRFNILFNMTLRVVPINN